MGRKNGSILIEVLLTVVIVSVSLTIIIGGLMSGYRLTFFNADYSQALVLLENQMTRWQYVGFKSASSTDLVLGEKTFTLDVRTDPMAEHLKTVALDLRWKSGKKAMSVSVDTCYLDTKDGAR